MVRAWFGFIVLAAAGICTAQPQDVTGDWIGTVSRPVGELRIALHISKADGALKATLDSVDQGISGIPMDSIKLADSKLSFSISAFQLSYEGTVDGKATGIEGEITSDAGSAPLKFHRGTAAKVEHKPAKPTDIDGDWQGILGEGAELPAAVVVHIINTEDGLMATLDQPSAHVKGAVASSVERKDSTVSIEWKVFGSKFEGKIGDGGNVIDGNVTQRGNVVPLRLTRGKA